MLKVEEILRRQKMHEDDLKKIIVNDKGQTAEQVEFGINPLSNVPLEDPPDKDENEEIDDKYSGNDRFELMDL